jgi:hypothetical protein
MNADLKVPYAKMECVRVELVIMCGFGGQARMPAAALSDGQLQCL